MAPRPQRSHAESFYRRWLLLLLLLLPGINTRGSNLSALYNNSELGLKVTSADAGSRARFCGAESDMETNMSGSFAREMYLLN
jgi:hypothetical protein